MEILMPARIVVDDKLLDLRDAYRCTTCKGCTKNKWNYPGNGNHLPSDWMCFHITDISCGICRFNDNPKPWTELWGDGTE
jgi:hypothetical protein